MDLLVSFRNLSKEDSIKVLNVLSEVIFQTQDKQCCTRALWCLSKQTLGTEVLDKQVHA